ncbi:MAG TPA: hemerythrin domain-containing protein [Labilithrix sp.]|jgi:hypothetical protein
MNAIDLLKAQHQKTKDALEEMIENEDMDPQELRLIADELVAHMVIEEHVFYPRVKELDEDLIVESFEEHAVARFELGRVMIAKNDEEKKARLNVLKELVEHHIEEEETELLPKVRARIPTKELEALGEKMEMLFDKACDAGLEKLVVSSDQSLRRSNGRSALAR